MSGILPAWTAVTDWLAAYAPASHSALRPGAAPTEVRRAEDVLGMNLPAELAMLLSACDGTVDTSALDRDPDEYDPGLFVAQHHLLPLTEIGAVRSTAGSTKEFWGAWIPVAVADYALAPWSGLAIDPDGRLAEFSLADGEPPSPLAAPGYRTLTEFIEALAEVLTQDTGPLAGGVIPGLHRGALVWGPLPGDGAPWMPVQPQVGPTA